MKSRFSNLRCESCSFVCFFSFVQFFPPSLLLKLKVPAGLFVRRAVCVLSEVVKVAVVQRSVHLTEEQGVNARCVVCAAAAAADRRTLRNTHGWCVRRVYAPLTEAFPVEALEPPEGQMQVAMATV